MFDLVFRVLQLKSISLLQKTKRKRKNSTCPPSLKPRRIKKTKKRVPFRGRWWLVHRIIRGLLCECKNHPNYVFFLIFMSISNIIIQCSWIDILNSKTWSLALLFLYLLFHHGVYFLSLFFIPMIISLSNCINHNPLPFSWFFCFPFCFKCFKPMFIFSNSLKKCEHWFLLCSHIWCRYKYSSIIFYV